MKKKFVIVSILTVLSVAQITMDNMGLDYFGGGIGPSCTWLRLDASSIFKEELSDFNLQAFDETMIFLKGVEGYGHVTENYRLGAFFSLGSVSTAATDTIDTGAGLLLRDSRGEFNISIVGGLFEAVYTDIFALRNFEISLGSVIGVGKVNFIRQSDIGSNPIWDAGYWNNGENEYTGYDSRSSNFGLLQPYCSAKYQFLNRMGLRCTAGYNIAKVGDGAWILNGEDRINGSPELNLNAIFLRATLYLGL